MPLINFSGIASGLDSESLIKAQSDAKRTTQVTPLRTKVTELTDTNDKLDELKSKLSKLQSTLQEISSLSGGAVSKEATSSDETIFTATAATGTTNGTYSINVTQKATNGVFTMADTFGSTSAVVNASIVNGNPAADRTLSYTIGTGGDAETVDIVLTSTMTVADLVTAFNSQSTNAVMSAVNVGTPAVPSYKLVVSSLNEGTALGSISASRGSDLTGLAIFNPAAATQQAAANAVFDVAGVALGSLDPRIP